MVAQLIGGLASGIMGLFQNRQANNYNEQSAMRSLEDAKKISKYNANLDYNNSVKLLRKQSVYNDKYLSNSSKATLTLNQQLMDYQYALERQSRQSSFQDTRKDLESAGYNPLLAVGNQSGYTSVGSGVSTSDAETQDIANNLSRAQAEQGYINSATSAYGTYNQARNLTKQTDSNVISSKYENALNIAKEELTHSQTRGQDIQNDIQDSYGKEQALANLDLTKQQKNNLSRQMDVMQAQAMFYRQMTDTQSAQSELLRQQRDLQESARAWHKAHPKMTGFSYGLKNLLTGNYGNSNGSAIGTVTSALQSLAMLGIK